MTNAAWPTLPYEAWKDTYETLHMWTQIVGKIRLARMPWLNHCWQVTLYPTARGLTTGTMPYADAQLQIDFDFVAHELDVQTSRGERRSIALVPMTVADFYHAVMAALAAVGMPVQIYRFCGKASPVHFFWGSFDLAVTRFSGRTAPPHPGGVPNLPDRVTRDAYSHEVSSCGFWPGGAQAPYPLFYSYAYPEPVGFAGARVQPAEARYDASLHEFVLPYAAVSAADAPEEKLLAFLQSSYQAAAEHGHWDRPSLEAAPAG
jgi:Family of unknown function (DUF5996)